MLIYRDFDNEFEICCDLSEEPSSEYLKYVTNEINQLEQDGIKCIYYSFYDIKHPKRIKSLQTLKRSLNDPNKVIFYDKCEDNVPFSYSSVRVSIFQLVDFLRICRPLIPSVEPLFSMDLSVCSDNVFLSLYK